MCTRYTGISSLSASHNSQNPWLAVVMEEGREPHDTKKSVYLINQKIQNIPERLNIGKHLYLNVSLCTFSIDVYIKPKTLCLQKHI